MNPYLYLILFFPALYVALTLVYVFALFAREDQGKRSKDQKISILVAARDEEDNILACMQALAKIDYPTDNFEVLIGDDDSSDRTGEIARAFCEKHPNFHYHLIQESFPNIHGKQNVLAKLAHAATGDFFLITDADIKVEAQWPATLMAHFTPKMGMVCGPTLVEGKSLFAHMQSLDWLMGVSLARAHSVLGIPVTGVGNNMAIRKEAYFSVGGYEGVPFSVTEDYKLFQVVCEKGPWEFRQLFEPGAINTSEPMHTVQQWFRQRRRWFKGGLELAWYNLAALFVNALSIPAVIALLFLAPPAWGIGAYAAKIGADFLILAIGTAKMQRFRWMIWFPLYEIYYHIIAVITPLQQLVPGKVKWKGREY